MKKKCNFQYTIVYTHKLILKSKVNASLTERQTHRKTDSKENSLGNSGLRVNIINMIYSIRIIDPE